jgi:hypothetical protein
MNRTSFMLMLLLVLVTPLVTLAGPKDDVSSGFGSTETLQSTPGPTPFLRIATGNRLRVRHGSALSTEIATGVG